jgi:hypothetical protein
VRKSGGRSFGLTVYLLPHYDSHPAPWAQQAFTCCADLNGGSALFFGWSENYIRQTSIYAFIQKSLNLIILFTSNRGIPIQKPWDLIRFNIKKSKKLRFDKSCVRKNIPVFPRITVWFFGELVVSNNGYYINSHNF